MHMAIRIRPINMYKADIDMLFLLPFLLNVDPGMMSPKPNQTYRIINFLKKMKERERSKENIIPNRSLST